MASKTAAVAVVSLESTCRGDTSPTIYFSLGFHPHLLFPRTRKGSVFASYCLKALLFNNPHCLETISSLQAFRKRHSEAQRLSANYTSLPSTVNFAHYRSVLKNQAIVDEAEKIFNSFQPVTYDVKAHVKAIETFEATAVSTALSNRPIDIQHTPFFYP